ncbi:CHAD domain-containing protein [Paraburkholderia sp. BL8N3]|jgi:CHAD domain-containing protein|nr:CHAD domain-containing protein [Paraburkholderia sp. BL8N3]TCK38291.1 CHAD domain-containing protein [Paraburkholderia sp. BL8N3]
MTVWLELALYALDEPADQLAAALDSLASLGGAKGVRIEVFSQEIDIGVPDWQLSVDTEGAARTVRAVHCMQPALPGLSRYRVFARPVSGSTAESLQELIASDDALAKPLAKAGEAPRGAGRDILRIEWRAQMNGTSILARLESGRGERAALRLAVPLADGAGAPESPDVPESLVRLAYEVIDRAPFFVAARDAHAASAEPVHASKLDLPLDATPREAFAAILASVASHWFGNDFAGRTSLDVEHVHQLRVAQRRLRTALKIFPEYADDAWNETIAPDLKWFGGVLADARDWDVFTDTTLPAYAGADDDPESWRPAIDAADARRRAAREAAREALHSKRYTRLTLHFIAWLARLAMRGGDESATLAHYARRRIRKQFRKIEGVPDLTTLDAHARHRVRIHAKRLRYALEFFRSLTTQRTRDKVARQLGRLQTVLGEANDAAVAAQRLARIAEATDYQRGFARAWAAAAQRRDAEEGERVLRSVGRPRVRASL